MAAYLSEERRAKVWLLHIKHTRGSRGNLSRNILREVCSFLHPITLLVHVTESYIRSFDFRRGAWKQQCPLHFHIKADSGSRWVVLKNGSVFICGGGRPAGWNTAYIVGNECAEQGQMHETRYWHGVVAYNSHAVYVFGGIGSRGDLVNSCEKYHLQQHLWTLLPPTQQTRARFNPCLFHESIYLCGIGSLLLEVFSPLSDQILPFRLSMPVDSWCCMYVEENLLVVHLDYIILKFRAGQAEELVQVSRSRTQKSVKWQNSQPVVDATLRVYYIVQNESCYSVNMDTGVVGPAKW